MDLKGRLARGRIESSVSSSARRAQIARCLARGIELEIADARIEKHLRSGKIVLASRRTRR
jgi:hypothetical protein